jgi:energy-coupling factor transporter ATP-binding protein EcfA2
MKALFIIGPSGSGKSTLAAKLAELHSEMFGKDSAVLVNLDCANEGGEIDICSIVRLDDIMEEYEIGYAQLYADRMPPCSMQPNS